MIETIVPYIACSGRVSPRWDSVADLGSDKGGDSGTGGEGETEGFGDGEGAGGWGEFPVEGAGVEIIGGEIEAGSELGGGEPPR